MKDPWVNRLVQVYLCAISSIKIIDLLHTLIELISLSKNFYGLAED